MSLRPRHLDVGRKDYDLGRRLYGQRKDDEAEEAFRQSARRRENELGEDDKDTLESKHWLGNVLYRQKNYNEAKKVLQQAVQGRERIFGEDNEDTLDSMHCLGLVLYHQRKYKGAEKILQQVVQRGEKALGKDHEGTLESMHCLGLALYHQSKYDDAEKVLQQAVQGREKIFGEDNESILLSMHWLGSAIYRQKKYNDAEKVLQQVVQRGEKALGKDHEGTLDSMHCLGLALYHQSKYDEAKTVFQQAAQGQEKVLGRNDVDTLGSMQWLGCALYRQSKYDDAEKVLQQAVQGREEVLGKGNESTLRSMHWLGLALYYQSKYNDAEKVLQEAAQGREKVLGRNDEETLGSKHLLGCALGGQKKYQEAEELCQQVVQGREKTLGKEHVDTVASRLLLQELQLKLALSPPLPTNNATQARTSRLSNFFAEGKESRAPYTDSEIYEISSLLKRFNPRWSKVPRTYIILRTIGCLNLLDEFIDVGFSDHWFPVTKRSLPHCLRPSVCTEFMSVQDLVLTKSMDLERGERGQHCYFKRNEILPFERKEVLGSGGFGEVDKVLCLISFKEYARKRVLRSSLFRSRGTEDMKLFIAEIEILKRLNHHHIVEFVGSYTDPKYMGLIMSPIADTDLATYLTNANTSKYGELRTFFGCLATALEFLHGQKIRHKDIKPGNVLVHGGNVLLTDFGLSLDFTEANRSTTMSMVNGMTLRYCAPEVVLQEPRNTSSDVWSLGVVFLEMIVVLKGKTIEYIDEFFEGHGSRQIHVRTNHAALTELLEELYSTGRVSDNRPLSWIQSMLQVERNLRPTAASLVASITATDTERGGKGAFCGICCAYLDESSSEYLEEVGGNP